VNRFDFQNLAQERLSDAESLFASGRFNCAYYVAGYAVECALKACIAHKTKVDDFPPRDTRKIYSHDLVDLLDSAGLKTEFIDVTGRDFLLEASWVIVKDWSETARYENNKDRLWAEMMLDAISNPQNGILQWLKKYW
jgi:HEPN domain-containing protein